MDSDLEAIVACMAVGPHPSSSRIQCTQTAHRLRLARFWGVCQGARILEVGCGQGDTTAVLAHLVGPAGFVHALDAASADYGAPLTLGDAAAALSASRLGPRLRIDLGLDPTSAAVDFPPHAFDLVVLSHCSWYLPELDTLTELLRRTRAWGGALAFAEWDPRITGPHQVPHFLAALIQAEYECFKPASTANIRTLVTPADVRRLAEAAGWTIVREGVVTAEDLDDGHWEVEQTLSGCAAELARLTAMPARFRSLVAAQAGLLREALTAGEPVRSMDSYALVAR